MATARCPRYARVRLNGMRASAPAHALCADARAWIDRDAAGSRVRDIIQPRWRDAHYYHRAAAVHRYCR